MANDANMNGAEPENEKTGASSSFGSNGGTPKNNTKEQEKNNFLDEHRILGSILSIFRSLLDGVKQLVYVVTGFIPGMQNARMKDEIDRQNKQIQNLKSDLDHEKNKNARAEHEVQSEREASQRPDPEQTKQTIDAFNKSKATHDALNLIYAKIGLQIMVDKESGLVRLMKNDGRFGSAILALSSKDLVLGDAKGLGEAMRRYTFSAMDKDTRAALTPQERETLTRDCYLKAAMAMAATQITLAKGYYEECQVKGQSMDLLDSPVTFESPTGVDQIAIKTDPTKMDCITVTYNGHDFKMTKDELLSMDPKIFAALEKKIDGLVRSQTREVTAGENVYVQAGRVNGKQGPRSVKGNVFIQKENGNISVLTDITDTHKAGESAAALTYHGKLENATDIHELSQKLKENGVRFGIPSRDGDKGVRLSSVSTAVILAVMANPDVHLGTGEDGKAINLASGNPESPARTHLSIVRTVNAVSVVGIIPEEIKDEAGNKSVVHKTQDIITFKNVSELNDPEKMEKFVRNMAKYEEVYKQAPRVFVKGYKRMDYTRESDPIHYRVSERGMDIKDIIDEYNRNAEIEGRDTIQSPWREENGEQDPQEREKQEEQKEQQPGQEEEKTPRTDEEFMRPEDDFSHAFEDAQRDFDVDDRSETDVDDGIEL